MLSVRVRRQRIGSVPIMHFPCSLAVSQEAAFAFVHSTSRRRLGIDDEKHGHVKICQILAQVQMRKERK